MGLIVALHGLPTGPRLWERVTVPRGYHLIRPQVPGLGADGTPDDFSLEWAATQLSQRWATDEADVLMGHDMGGVLAAMLAQPGQKVVLSGTALGPYWSLIRMTAWPFFNRAFYHRYAGRTFLRRGCLPEHRETLLDAFADHGPGWAERMRRIAMAMKPPRALGLDLRRNDVLLAWGRQDPWYPPFPVARAVAAACRGRLELLEAGHFAPWEAPGGFSEALAAFLPPPTERRTGDAAG
ncbi:MAG: alpha/beta hydrolase [Deltaproteobacteria bacterium]|nr:alpha/beta hydrolase [Deltaproteobacteria bacterium]